MTIYTVLPCFNEASNLNNLLQAFVELSSEVEQNMVIYLIDDGSTDNSVSIAQPFTALLNLNIIEKKLNSGLGDTIRRGFNEVLSVVNPNDIVVTMDADDTHLPKYIRAMINALNAGFDISIASRYQDGSTIHGLSYFRRSLSYVASLLFRLNYPADGLKDYTCGYRAYRGELLIKADKKFGEEFVDQQGFSCMADILLKLLFFNPKIQEVPFALRYDRKMGDSKMKIFTTIWSTLKLIRLRRQL